MKKGNFILLLYFVLSFSIFALQCWSEVGLSIGGIATGSAVGNDKVVIQGTNTNPAFLVPSSVAVVCTTDFMVPVWNDLDIGIGVAIHTIGLFEFPKRSNTPFVPIYLSTIYKIGGETSGIVSKVGASINLEPYLGIGYRYKTVEFGMDFGLLDRNIQKFEIDVSSHWIIPKYVPYGGYYISIRIPVLENNESIIKKSNKMASGLTWAGITTGGLFYFVGAMLLNIL